MSDTGGASGGRAAHADAADVTSATERSSGSGRAGRREWAGLAVLTLPVLLVSMDMTVLHLAIPKITADLNPDGPQVLWIVDIYAFVVAGLLITMGALGDRIGRRRLLLLGATGFAVASVAAAFATGPAMLIASRAALGVAGATLAPSTLSLIRTMFTDDRQRSTATSVWVLAFLVGGSIGPVVGGLLLQHFWWGSVFLLGVPVMAVLLIAGPFVLPEYRAPDRPTLDLTSAALSLAAVLAVVYGLKELAAGDGAAVPLLVTLAGIAMAAVFALRQRRLTHPLVDLDLFRQRPFAVAIAVLTLGVIVLAGMGFLAAQYLQLVLGLEPLAAGLWTLPPLAAGVVAVIATQILDTRLSHRVGTVGGLVLAAAGLVVLAQLPTSGVTVVVVGLAVLFAGVMPVLARGVDTVTGAVAPERAGAAAALSETTQELGGALGIAVMGSIAAAAYRTRLAPTLDEQPPEVATAAGDNLAEALHGASTVPPEVITAASAAFTHGINLASAIAAATVLVAAAATAAALTRRRPPDAD